MRDRTARQARRRGLGLLVATLAAAALAACGEKLEGGAACPILCPAQDVVIQDTVLDPVVLDTTIAGLPTPGTEGFLLLTSRGDTVDTRVVVRYDTLPKTFVKSGGDSAITSVDSAFTMLYVDTTGTVATQPVTIEAYDVDSAAVDTGTAALLSLFRADRLVGSATFAVADLKDSLRIPLNNAAVLAKVRDSLPLRLGYRVTSAGSVQLRLFSTELAQPVRLSFDPSPDTTIAALSIGPTSATPPGTLLRADLRDFTIVARSPNVADPHMLAVGGLPSRRSFLRFSIPQAIVDSSTVLRATLLLTQIPNARARAADTITVFPQIVTASTAVTDVGRAADILGTAGSLIDSVRFVLRDGGEREIDIVNALRNWRAQVGSATQTQRAIVLRARLEGASPLEVSFYSTEAETSLRPRLRVSYVTRLNFGRP